jgi:hypothetical protein
VDKPLPDVVAPDLDVLFCGLALGLGITDVVDRPTRAAAELTRDELRAGAAWAVPNPSGLDAHHQVADLARA